MKMKKKVQVHGSLCWHRSPHCSSAFCQLPLASDPYCIGNKNNGCITCSMCYLSDSWLDVQLFPLMEERKKQKKPQYISVVWKFRDRSSGKKCCRKEMFISSSGSSRKKVRAKASFQSPTFDEKYFILIPHICFKLQQTKLTVEILHVLSCKWELQVYLITGVSELALCQRPAMVWALILMLILIILI